MRSPVEQGVSQVRRRCAVELINDFEINSKSSTLLIAPLSNTANNSLNAQISMPNLYSRLPLGMIPSEFCYAPLVITARMLVLADPLNNTCFVFIIIMLPNVFKILKAGFYEIGNEHTVFINIQMPVFDKCMHDTIQSSDGERRGVGKWIQLNASAAVTTSTHCFHVAHTYTCFDEMTTETSPFVDT